MDAGLNVGAVAAVVVGLNKTNTNVKFNLKYGIC
jgi:hypothetical protein